MTVTIEVPAGYGWVIMTAGLGPFITNMMLAGPVMAARKSMNVPYPNCYAVPGYHKQADDFNRVQRGHQNYLESIDQYTCMTLLGGLKHPYTCAFGALCYFVGSKIYQIGYSDTTKDAVDARYKAYGGLAAIKWIGMFASFFSTASLAYSVITSE